MNNAMAQICFRRAWRWLALLAGMLALTGVRAAAPPQANRFLLVFETSHAMKKNLPAIRQALDGLFSSNLQNEMRENDDLAVWTVDEKLHTDTFPLASWAPGDAVGYSARLKDFLRHQRFPRHASLAALQPLLNRVMQSSERLTVLIFCDGESRLQGTPYDSGVNEIITNAAARIKGGQPMFVIVLRSYHGEYLGCSVNRSLPLNFPKFPPPPKPVAPPKAEPPPKVEPLPAPAVVVPPVPALIIVGTKASTNLSALTNLVAAPTPVPVPKAPETNAPATNAPLAKAPATNAPTTNAIVMKAPPAAAPASEAITSAPAPQIAVAPPPQPAPAPNPPPPAKPLPAPIPIVQKTSAPAPVVVAVPAIATNRPPAPPSNTVAVSAGKTETASDTGSRWPLVLGGGLLMAAAGLVTWLAVRTRRPRGSLITSSLRDDPRLPPRK